MPFLFFLSRTAHESASAYAKRASASLLAAGVSDVDGREPVARGAFVLRGGVRIGYIAYSG